MSNFNPCLCVVFNHPFPQALPVLDEIYTSRFPTIRYIMPFERPSDRDDVITVYRGSYHHQGFVTDAASKLRDVDCSHYIFIQDDVLLNPRINAGNLDRVLGIGPTDGFIPQLRSIDMDIGDWHWMPGILWRMWYPRNLLSGSGVDSMAMMLRYLPHLDEAEARAARYGVSRPIIRRSDKSLDEASVISMIPHFGTLDRGLVAELNKIIVASLYETAPGKNIIEVPYPFAMTAWGADFYILPKKNLDMFSHYVGVLAAAAIFAEISVGTAMILTADNVKTSSDNGTTFDWRWDNERDRMDIAELVEAFKNEKLIAMHPFKFGMLQKDPNRFQQLMSAIKTVS